MDCSLRMIDKSCSSNVTVQIAIERKKDITRNRMVKAALRMMGKGRAVGTDEVKVQEV